MPPTAAPHGLFVASFCCNQIKGKEKRRRGLAPDADARCFRRNRQHNRGRRRDAGGFGSIGLLARASRKSSGRHLHHRSPRGCAVSNSDEAQTSVPADALRRSPEPARPGGSSRQSADQPRRQPARVTRSSTALSEIEDRQRRRLLLLPTPRLPRAFLRRCFHFSLLRHCCPPSLSGWRHRCSAVANRSALSSEIHKRKKINSRSD